MARTPHAQAGWTRAQMILAMSELLEAQGYFATGLNDVVAASGTPRGSLYYHFPHGKTELTTLAVERAGRTVAERIETGLAGGGALPAALHDFVERIAAGVEKSGFRSGGPLMIVAIETANENRDINRACRRAYDRIQKAFRTRIEAGGYAPRRAAELAIFITAAIEGGIILSRTYHTGAPLRRVADELRVLLENS